MAVKANKRPIVLPFYLISTVFRWNYSPHISQTKPWETSIVSATKRVYLKKAVMVVQYFS